jgi:hypothetical protein
MLFEPVPVVCDLTSASARLALLPSRRAANQAVRACQLSPLTRERLAPDL